MGRRGHNHDSDEKHGNCIRHTYNDVNNFGENGSSIWITADLLRRPYRPDQFKDAVLPLTVLRLDRVLEPTKGKILDLLKKSIVISRESPTLLEEEAA